MARIYWPALFCPMTPVITVVSRSVLGPATLTGAQQAVASPAGAWRVAFEGIPLHTDARIEAWRALEVMIDGRSNQIVVPLNQRDASVPLLAPGTTSASVPHGDDALFSDDTGYLQSLAAADVVTAADMGATSLRLAATTVSALRPGMMFSIVNRLYRIRAVETAAGVSEVSLWPPLRDDVPAGEQAEFKRLTCTMRLAEDGAMSTPLLLGRIGTASVEFVEDTL